jgi:predicted small lipoprotein YifL
MFDQRWGRLAAIGALVAALGLAACGRKGPLDAPPGAALPQEAAVPGAPPPALSQPSAIGNTQTSEASIGRDNTRVAAPPPSGRRQPFILDWLLD